MANYDPSPATRFKPGIVHPHPGRPKSKILYYLGKIGSQVVNGKTKDEWLALKIYDMAMKGNIIAAKEILDRKEGKVKDVLEATTSGTINIQVVSYSAAPVVEGKCPKK